MSGLQASVRANESEKDDSMIFTPISKQENDTFSRAHSKGHIFQNSQWAAVKSHWKADYIGGYDEKGKLALTCVVLIRTFTPIQISVGYIPRGPVCDYSDWAILQEFADHLHSLCREKHIGFMILDPDIPVRVDGVPEQAGEKAAALLKHCGLRIKRTDNFELIQANSVFRLHWENDGDKQKILQSIQKGFDSKTRYNIGVAERRGLKVEIYDASDIPEERLRIFDGLMRQTGKRDRFVPRGRMYFRRLLDSLGSDARVFLIRYDPEKDLEYARAERARVLEQLRRSRRDAGAGNACGRKKECPKCAELERQLENLENRCEKVSLRTKNGSSYLAGSILGIWGEKSWYLYGASADCCRDTMPGYLLQWAMIRSAVETGCRMYDLRGVPAHPEKDNPLYGLYRFKKGFGGRLEEFPGELFLVNNRLDYWMFRFTFTHFKTIREALMRVLAFPKGKSECCEMN